MLPQNPWFSEEPTASLVLQCSLLLHFVVLNLFLDCRTCCGVYGPVSQGWTVEHAVMGLSHRTGLQNMLWGLWTCPTWVVNCLWQTKVTQHWPKEATLAEKPWVSKEHLVHPIHQCHQVRCLRTNLEHWRRRRSCACCLLTTLKTPHCLFFLLPESLIFRGTNLSFGALGFPSSSRFLGGPAFPASLDGEAVFGFGGLPLFLGFAWHAASVSVGSSASFLLSSCSALCFWVVSDVFFSLAAVLLLLLSWGSVCPFRFLPALLPENGENKRLQSHRKRVVNKTEVSTRSSKRS